MPAIITLPFIESFDHYDIQNSKWMVAGPGSSINLSNTGISRTGIGCLVCTQTDGPQILIPTLNRIVWGGAFRPGGFPAGPTDFGQIYTWRSINDNSSQVRIGVFNDGSLVVKNGNDPIAIVIAQSAAGVINPTAYNYIEVDVTIGPSSPLTVRVNQVPVIDVTGVRTQDPGSSAVVDLFQLKALGLFVNSRHDDIYARDPGSLPQGGAFYGAIRVNVASAVEDALPLQWDTSTGVEHFSLVNEIPPDDGATYVSADAPGAAVDQYLYNTAGIAAGSYIPVVQHSMDAQLIGAGSGAMGSSCAEITSGDVQITADYNMVIVPYELDPRTNQAWVATDLSTTPFGPVVTG